MRNRLPLTVLGLALAGCTAPTAPGPLEGQWGGPHAGLVISELSARLEFDCAGGTIPGLIVLDRTGRFSRDGDFIRGGGPVSIDDSTRAEPARYAGQVRGGTMELTVTLLEQGATYGPFTLTRGGDPRVFKCL
ncbi:MAG TPA: hypothetical protein VGQ17_01935 [Gemmatimonadales bacterium]|nr:hypothetical protein [Gemmatimonadales bacterium]